MILNLDRYRKKCRRAESAAQAGENRMRFGQSKGKREAEERDQDRAAKELDNKRLG